MPLPEKTPAEQLAEHLASRYGLQMNPAQTQELINTINEIFAPVPANEPAKKRSRRGKNAD